MDGRAANPPAVTLRGTCDRARVLDLVDNLTLFSKHKSGLVNIIGQNHQFLGVNHAIASMLAARKLGHGRGGVDSCHFPGFQLGFEFGDALLQRSGRNFHFGFGVARGDVLGASCVNRTDGGPVGEGQGVGGPLSDQVRTGSVSCFGSAGGGYVVHTPTTGSAHRSASGPCHWLAAASPSRPADQGGDECISLYSQARE